MRAASLMPLALALVAILFVILIARAYDAEVASQLRCLPDDPDACVIVP